MEPYNLCRWKWKGSADPVQVYSCARPGRSFGRDKHEISDEVVKMWFEGLPKHRPLTIISLLGWKPKGKNEYSFYSFKSGEDFRDWVACHIGSDVDMHCLPTVDFEPVSKEIIDQSKLILEKGLVAGHCVLIMDSGGQTRSGEVCRGMGLTEV